MSQTGAENLTLTEADLAQCKPLLAQGGRIIRARCPFHGSDHQRSLRLDRETGRFQCFACGAWGYTEDARSRWRGERADRQCSLRTGQKQTARPSRTTAQQPARLQVTAQEQQPPPSRLTALLATYMATLPGSPGEEYLRRRGIPLSLALRYKLGYAGPGQWAHPTRDWREGRLIVPHTTPDGWLVNLYGRAVELAAPAPKTLRHDHLPGEKGYFNAQALQSGEEAVFVCEGAFDALSLIAVGYTRAVAIYGVNGWRWEWGRQVRKVVFALDADQAGAGWRTLAREARLRGKQVGFLPESTYGGYKDVNDAWVAGTLVLEPSEGLPM